MTGESNEDYLLFKKKNTRTNDRFEIIEIKIKFD